MIFIADLKIIDSRLHEKYTGFSNARILENFERLCENDGVRLIVRIPVIPKVNDNIRNAESTADFIENRLHSRVEVVQLLKYMSLGEEKYRSLGKAYPYENLTYNKDAFDSRVEHIRQYFESRSICCITGTSIKEN